ncbi:hypothetical protein V5O48_001452 [Marasmius crinis-equi]|uniref:Uncharacterized protein n=1 Tax=Marasmius crinis-equi TaxID=585013 RepID=A0ABR3FYE2_9AGAR
MRMETSWKNSWFILTVALPLSSSLKIDPIPADPPVIQGQPVTFTWHREPNDPSNFAIGKEELSGVAQGFNFSQSGIATIDNPSLPSGNATLSFVNTGQFMIVAVALPEAARNFPIIGSQKVSVAPSSSPTEGISSSRSTSFETSQDESSSSRSITSISKSAELDFSSIMTSSTQVAAPTGSAITRQSDGTTRSMQTNPTSTPNASSSSSLHSSPDTKKTAIIIGTTIAATIVVFAVAGILVCYRWRRYRFDFKSGMWHPRNPDTEKKRRRKPQGAGPSMSVSYSLPSSLIETPSSENLEDDARLQNRIATWRSHNMATREPPRARQLLAAEPQVGARTERQMKIEERIFELQVQMLSLNDKLRIERVVGRSDVVPLESERPEETERQLAEVKEMIEKLKIVQGGWWARELSDEVPKELL